MACSFSDATAALLLGTLLIGAAPVERTPADQPHHHADDGCEVPQGIDGRIDGEHGLWVSTTADSLRVQWLMETPRAGRLIVRTADGERTFDTPAGSTHAVTLPLPPATALTLRYGAAEAGDALYETFVELAEPRRPAVEFAAVDSLYIVGDTHGVFDALIAGLHGAGLIDEHQRWSGGRRHLVVAGDMMDRGPDVHQLLWFVYRLEREASAAGGAVHVLLGNHEVMVLLGDLRYVHPKEQLVAEMHGAAYDRIFDIRSSILGRWIASKPAAIRIGNVLIAHGGVRPVHLQPSLQALDDSLRQYVAEDLFYHWADSTAAPITMDSASYQRREDFFFAPGSVFWYRAYVQTDTAAVELDEVLRLQNADLHVVAHTAVTTMQSRYDGRLIAAHTPRFGAELVLLVNENGVLRRFRVAGRRIEDLP